MLLEVIPYHSSLLQSFLTYYLKINKPSNDGSIPLNYFSYISQDYQSLWKSTATYVWMASSPAIFIFNKRSFQ